jgi:hypothetical protein
MVDLFCRDHHPPDGWHRCEECQEFLRYAHERLARCPFQESKPVCNECPIHCYKPEQRRQARIVMRYSGPRMILYHPIQAVRHMIEARRERPPRHGPVRHQPPEGTTA